MSQRFKQNPSTLNSEPTNCETYMTRVLRRDKSVPPVKQGTNSTSKFIRERSSSVIRQTNQSNNQLAKARTNVKQQNKTSQPSSNTVQYTTDDSALVQVTVKTNGRPRSRSNVNEKEPWGQLLTQKNKNSGSSFNSFDPLRTLHFLAKELQFRLHSVCPDDNNMVQIINDMQQALQRVPPEVASAIHLQQGYINMNERTPSSGSLEYEKPEKLQVIKPCMTEKVTQTSKSLCQDDNDKIQKIMEESTKKLESSCRQMEILCTRLKNEKEELEQKLKMEKENVAFYQRRAEDLDNENRDLIEIRIRKLEQEKEQLESRTRELNSKISSVNCPSAQDLKLLVNELKLHKQTADQELGKLKHQLRLCDIEKEKYVALLSVRDRQINDIRNEMTQLQEVVNDQLMELHNSAFACMPNSDNTGNSWAAAHDNKENQIGDMGEQTPSSIQTQEDVNPYYMIKHTNSLKDLPSGDSATSTILQEVTENMYMNRPNNNLMSKTKVNKGTKRSELTNPHLMKKQESQASIKDMFRELKKQALSISSSSNSRNHIPSFGK